MAIARNILIDHAAAEDVLQRVFCAALSLPRKRITAIDDLTAYLAGAVRNDALNQQRESARRTSRERTSQRSGPQPVVVSTDPDLATALEAMPQRDQEIIVLKHSGGLTFEQIAVVLELNRNTIASRYRAALKCLRRTLDAGEPNEAQPTPNAEVSNAR
jgi:RNA polymerase sigma factor (sigma-70 family)